MFRKTIASVWQCSRLVSYCWISLSAWMRNWKSKRFCRLPFQSCQPLQDQKTMEYLRCCPLADRLAFSTQRFTCILELTFIAGDRTIFLHLVRCSNKINIFFIHLCPFEWRVSRNALSPQPYKNHSYSFTSSSFLRTKSSKVNEWQAKYENVFLRTQYTVFLVLVCKSCISKYGSVQINKKPK